MYHEYTTQINIWFIFHVYIYTHIYIYTYIVNPDVAEICMVGKQSLEWTYL